MTRKKDHTERELVAGCRRNDRYFQEMLYRRFFPTMQRMVQRYTTDPEVGLTIINNGLLKVFQKIDTYSFSGSLEGWIRRIVFRALADHFRSEKRSLQFLELENRDAPTVTGALDKLFLEDLLGLVDQLPAVSKEVFRLYCIEGYNHREIGEQLNMSEGTSKWHLSKAREKLRTLINRQYKDRSYAG
jgi:RNA polymerase sigma factor (sigma-70 family)